MAKVTVKTVENTVGRASGSAYVEANHVVVYGTGKKTIFPFATALEITVED